MIDPQLQNTDASPRLGDVPKGRAAKRFTQAKANGRNRNGPPSNDQISRTDLIVARRSCFRKEPAVSATALTTSPWCTAEEAAARLHVTRRTLERYRAAGIL